jgi:hypothetical protein
MTAPVTPPDNFAQDWAAASKPERMAFIAMVLNMATEDGCLDANQRDAVMARVGAHFLTHSMNTHEYVFNVVFRELWREDHGDTLEWDAAARAARLVAIPGRSRPALRDHQLSNTTAPGRQVCAHEWEGPDLCDI